MEKELPQIDWVKNDPKKHCYFTDRSVFLIALRVTNERKNETRWEFDVVEANCDGDGMFLVKRDCGCSYDGWQWGDVEYFKLLEGEMPTAEIDDPHEPTPDSAHLGGGKG